MSKDTVTCVVAKPGLPAEIVELAPGFGPIREVIGCSLLERFPFAPDPITCLVDEEGMLGGQKWNRNLGQPLAGPIVVTVFVPKGDGEHIQMSLHREDAEAFVAFLNRPEFALAPEPACFDSFEALSGQKAIQITDFDGNPV